MHRGQTVQRNLKYLISRHRVRLLRCHRVVVAQRNANMNPTAITTVQVLRNPGAIPIAIIIIIIHHLYRRLHRHRLTRNTKLKVNGSTLRTLDPTRLKRARANRHIAVEVAATRILESTLRPHETMVCVVYYLR